MREVRYVVLAQYTVYGMCFFSVRFVGRCEAHLKEERLRVPWAEIFRHFSGGLLLLLLFNLGKVIIN